MEKLYSLDEIVSIRLSVLYSYLDDEKTDADDREIIKIQINELEALVKTFYLQPSFNYYFIKK